MKNTLSNNNIAYQTEFLHNAEDYISVSCHYNTHTLLTKNGELIQTIQINGIDQENISKNILDLRKFIRSSLKRHINTTKIACWIHTVRRKSNLDDPTSYPNTVSQKIHDDWVKKNYWDDRFVNTLFISFVYEGYQFKINTAKSFIESFLVNKILKSHENYLSEAFKELDSIVDNVHNDLKEFGSKRLGIYYKGNTAYCSILSLLYGMLRGIEEPIKLNEIDLSKIIGNFAYAVGVNKIEVIANNKRKYYSLLSLKEYQEISTYSVSNLLQSPSEFVITEIFYFEEKKVIEKKIAYQSYISKVSRDPELSELKGIKHMQNLAKEYEVPFCEQQISIMFMDENLNRVENTTSNAAFNLAKSGLVHVREDINIENTFWAQIPGNFKFLRRLSPVAKDNTAAMAALHNFPVGGHENPWGKAITLLRTEYGTPFFFNFHQSKESSARVLLVGNLKSGKTTIVNFLVSESMKFRPSIIYISPMKDSKVFIKANGGKWFDNPFNLDPFKIPSIQKNKIVLKQYFLAMAGFNYNKLSPEMESEVEKLIEFILSFKNEDKTFEKVKDFNFDGETGETLKHLLKDYLPEGKYYKYFVDDGKWEQEKRNIMGICFKDYSNEVFEAKNKPNEDRELPKYYELYKEFITFRELLVYTNMFKFLDEYKSERQIIKYEDFNQLCTSTFMKEFYDEYFSRLSNEDIIYINSVDFIDKDKFFESELWQKMQGFFETKIYLPAETVNEIWRKKLMLNDDQFEKLRLIIPASRLFVITQGDFSINCELSIGNLTQILKVLSADQKLIDKCNRLIEQKGENPEDWILDYYKDDE